MIIYTVSDDDAMEGEIAFPTKAEAIAYAKAVAESGQPTSVTKIRVGKMPVRDMLCAVFNRLGYAAEQDVIARF